MAKNESVNREWKDWLFNVMLQRPHGNSYLDCPRGIEVGQLCIDFNRNDFNWHRSDHETFWIDVQLFVKYKLSNEEILFILSSQPGCDNYRKFSEERNAFAEFRRGFDKLRKLNDGTNKSTALCRTSAVQE